MASSSNSEFKCSYDIFLSFRGLDTRHKFTHYLYEALMQEGFATYRDNEGIEKGENINSELQKAIWNSSMSVIVLSRNYANSKSCLFEIQTILEHHKKKSDHVIFPVFYEVEPSDIREQAKHLDFKGKKVTDEEVKEWSAALQEVAKMKGFVYGNSRPEAEFIKEIIGALKSKQTDKHQRDLDENMRNLKRKVEYLSGQEVDINSQISNAERRPGKRPKKEVEVWLTNVQRFKDDVQRLEQKEVGETTNVSSRMRLGKDIAKKILEVQELQKKGSDFNSLMVDEDTTGRLLQPLTEDFVKCTKARNTENIWERLMNDDFTKIGVYGMGGVGKTTTMKYIQNRLLEEKGKFDKVYWVTVSKAFDITKLQSDIAKALKLSFSDDEDETIRALELHAELDRKKRYVLILDDVWDQFDLDSVGIPEPKRSNGCKLVLTTRSLEVCKRMNCTAVKVDLLTQEEALTLFRSIVVGNDSVLDPDVEEIAAKIAKQCACLPLAIVTLAGSCRVLEGIREWRNALNELISSTKDASDDVSKVFEQLKFSYSRLGKKVLQDCFLYCSLYPEDYQIPVDELIEYWIAEELITDMDSVDAQMNKGHDILRKLTHSCLLERFTGTYVRMHDLIRDMALKITKSGPRFMVKAGEKIKSVPYEHWSKDLERISFMNSSISELPITPPVCPRLTTLFLNSCYGGSMFSDSFFTNMPCLAVLNLSWSIITSLPESISNLENLHALILKSCEKLKYVPSLEKLKALKKFVLTSSQIEELPEGIEELVNLRKLDLSGNKTLRTFPSWKLRRLSKLEYLTIDGTGVEVSIEGLLCLRQLKVVAVHLHNVQELNRYVISQQFQGLQEYCLEVGEPRRGVLSCGTKLLRFRGKAFSICYKPVPFERGVDQPVLPAGLESFAVDGFHDPVSLSAIPWFKDAKELRNCWVTCCNRLESIFSSSTFSEDVQISLRTVELFYLKGLPRLRVLFDGIAPPHNIYFNLKELNITKCVAVKNIFPVQLLQNFPNLEKLCVEDCKNLEDIIVEKEEMSDRGNHQDYSNPIILPKLKRLYLSDLPRLKSIYNGVMVCPSIAKVDINKCQELRTIFPVQLLQNFPNLETLSVWGCENVEDIIVEIAEVSDRGNHQDYSNSISLPKLKNLTLEFLPRLKSIYNGVMVCPSIANVRICKCQELRTIFPVQLLQNFPNLKTLSVTECKNVEDIIVEIAEVSDRGNHQDYSNSISLPKLKDLTLGDLPRLKSIYNGVMVCPSIAFVEVHTCPMVRRMPLSMHMDGEQATTPPALGLIKIMAEKEWWESLEWDDPVTKTILQPYRENYADHSEYFDDDYSDIYDDFSEDSDDYVSMDTVDDLIGFNKTVRLLSFQFWDSIHLNK